jgi:hypothetical protein
MEWTRTISFSASPTSPTAKVSQSLWLIASKAKKRSFRGFPRDSGGAGSSFEKASERIVRINVDGRAWLKLGGAIAYYGDIEFKRLPALFPKGFGNQESGDEGLAGADPTSQEEGLAPGKEF